MTVFYDVEHSSREEDQSAQQSPIKTGTLIMPLKAMTVENPSERSGVTAGATVGMTAVMTAGVTAAAEEQQRSDGGLITER